MKRTLVAAAAAFVGAVAVESFAGPKDDAIKDLFGKLDRCLANNDATCVGDLFADDGSFSEPVSGAKITKGKAQIVKTLQGLLNATPTMSGAKQVHNVQSVRMLGDTHAFVDCSVAVTGMKAADGKGSATPTDAYHAVAVVVLKGDKWLFEDIRSYAVGPSVVPNKAEGSGPPPPGSKAPATGNAASPPGNAAPGTAAPTAGNPASPAGLPAPGPGGAAASTGNAAPATGSAPSAPGAGVPAAGAPAATKTAPPAGSPPAR